MSSSSSAIPSAASVKICFNSDCRDPTSEPNCSSISSSRRGWKLRSGDYAHLCDPCSCVYEKGTFCETFHVDAAGWRKCESCGKRVHCGCIVSAPSYLLLDAGGIECIVCAKKAFSMAPDNIWSPSLLPSSQLSERPKEHAVKTWNQMTGSFPGQWRQGPHLWNAGIQSDLQQRLSYEFDRPLHTERLITGVRASTSAQEKKVAETSERLASCSLNHVVHNGTVALDACSAFNMYREEGNTMQDSGHYLEDNAPGSSRKDQTLIAQSQRMMPPPLPKQLPPNSHNMNDASVKVRSGRPRVDAWARAQLLPRYWPRITDQELQQISSDSNSVITPLFEKILSASDAGRIGRLVLPKKCAEAYFPPISQPEGLPLKVQDANGKEWVFQFRFWPNNNSRMYVLEGVTPCIQSMQLQAGDTVTFSRIDPEGKLVMGFRKASNISERDSQTFKSGNGFSTPPESSINATEFGSNGPLRPQKCSAESRKLYNTADEAILSKFDKTGFIQKDVAATESSQGLSRRTGSTPGSRNKRLRIENEDSLELKLTWEEAQELLRPPPDDPSVFVIEGHEIEEYEESPILGKPTIFTTTQAGWLPLLEDLDVCGTKSWGSAVLAYLYREMSKVALMQNSELKGCLSLLQVWAWERLHLKPRLCTHLQLDGQIPLGCSESSQWAQCGDCSKWRKLPVDALLPSRWTCSNNKWDPERGSCSSAQEISTELTDILPSKAGSRRSKVKVENNDNFEVSDGLDTLANLAILGEGESLPPSSQPTTKHPRHRPGCSCIVCIQPPSGKGPKHKQTCTCNICLTVKRRFRTLMLRREKRQSEKESETVPPHQKQPLSQSPEMPSSSDPHLPAGICITSGSSPQSPAMHIEGETDDDPDKKIMLPSPLKAQIDLNIQPEREEEPLPMADAGSVMSTFVNTTN